MTNGKKKNTRGCPFRIVGLYQGKRKRTGLALADSRETESSTEYGSGIGYETKRRNAGSLAALQFNSWVAGGGSKKQGIRRSKRLSHITNWVCWINKINCLCLCITRSYGLRACATFAFATVSALAQFRISYSMILFYEDMRVKGAIG